jgi:putative NIF3 family GTP cyclohydrolase 1 type 2
MSGISLIEMSHFDTEKYFTEITKDIIAKEFDSNIPVFENNGENSPINKFK